MNNDVTNFAKNYVAAEAEAISAFVEAARTIGGVDEATAKAALAYYVKRKLAKFDHMTRRYALKAGNLYEAETLTAAAAK